jgi:hypothetical protein
MHPVLVGSYAVTHVAAQVGVEATGVLDESCINSVVRIYMLPLAICIGLGLMGLMAQGLGSNPEPS